MTRTSPIPGAAAPGDRTEEQALAAAVGAATGHAQVEGYGTTMDAATLYEGLQIERRRLAADADSA